VTARLRKLGTEIRDQGVGVTAAGVEVAAMKGEGAGAEVTIDMTGEVEVAAMKDGGAIAATATIEDQVTAVSCQTGGEVHFRGQDHARGIEDLFNETRRTNLLWPEFPEHAAALAADYGLAHTRPCCLMFVQPHSRPTPGPLPATMGTDSKTGDSINFQISISQTFEPG
jgi:hypothetical protein